MNLKDLLEIHRDIERHITKVENSGKIKLKISYLQGGWGGFSSITIFRAGAAKNELGVTFPAVPTGDMSQIKKTISDAAKLARRRFQTRQKKSPG